MFTYISTYPKYDACTPVVVTRLGKATCNRQPALYATGLPTVQLKNLKCGRLLYWGSFNYIMVTKLLFRYFNTLKQCFDIIFTISKRLFLFKLEKKTLIFSLIRK